VHIIFEVLTKNCNYPKFENKNVMEPHTMDLKKLTLSFIILLIIRYTPGQDFSAFQDSTLNNLVHPVGYKTCQIGELGEVKKKVMQNKV
jgi:hypothetical protein